METAISNTFITVQKLVLGTEEYDINSNNVLRLTIFNNIEQIGDTIEILFNDTTDMKTKLPIKGGEEISCIFVDQYKNKFKKTFVLTTVKEVKAINDMNQLIKIGAISKDSFYLGVNRDYSSYNSTVQDVISNYITFENSSPLTTEYQIIIPGFTHTKSIQYMLKNFTKSHVFFENNDNYIFADIDDLLIEGENTYEYENGNPYYRYNIIEWNEKSVFNGITETYKNIYKNQYLTYNPSTKSIDTIDKTIKTESAEANLQGTGNNYSEEIFENINTKYNIVPYSSTRLDDSSIIFNLFNKKFELLINGDLNVQVGSTIKIEKFERLMSATPNRLLAGDYLITKVAHHISSEEFMTKIEVVKNNYFKE